MGNTIGQKLSDCRGDRSQKEVAEAVGISVSALSMYEQDQRIPRDEIKVRLANYYHQTIGDLFFANDNHET